MIRILLEFDEYFWYSYIFATRCTRNRCHGDEKTVSDFAGNECLMKLSDELVFDKILIRSLSDDPLRETFARNIVVKVDEVNYDPLNPPKARRSCFC